MGVQCTVQLYLTQDAKKHRKKLSSIPPTDGSQGPGSAAAASLTCPPLVSCFLSVLPLCCLVWGVSTCVATLLRPLLARSETVCHLGALVHSRVVHQITWGGGWQEVTGRESIFSWRLVLCACCWHAAAVLPRADAVSPIVVIFCCHALSVPVPSVMFRISAGCRGRAAGSLSPCIVIHVCLLPFSLCAAAVLLLCCLV